jgi:transmembrane sensor
MQDDQRIILLISLQLNGEATPEELIELDTYIKNNPELSEKIEHIRNVWKNLSVGSTGLAESSFEKHLQRLNNEVFEPAITPEPSPVVPKESVVRPLFQKKHFRKLWVAAAAAVILLFLLLSRPTENEGVKPINNTVSTKAGDKANITLPDGSKVWLNGDSKITYAEDFNDRTREVHLSGEAFFEVAKDKTRPFIIHTRMINLKVLGTAFNVRSYDYEKETETALVHGSVEITLRNSPEQKILLKPGEKLLVKNIPVDTSSVHKKQTPDEDSHIIVLTNMRY